MKGVIKMATITSGVYPVYNNIFKISTNGRGETPSFAIIKECDTFTVALEDNIEEWTPFDTEGWTRRLVTGKSLTITITAKRYVGDPGNDYIAGKLLASGQNSCSVFQWTFADGAILTIPCVINVKNLGGGDSKVVAPVEFDIVSDGTPTYTAAPAA